MADPRGIHVDTGDTFPRGFHVVHLGGFHVEFFSGFLGFDERMPAAVHICDSLTFKVVVLLKIDAKVQIFVCPH